MFRPGVSILFLLTVSFALMCGACSKASVQKNAEPPAVAMATEAQETSVPASAASPTKPVIVYSRDADAAHAAFLEAQALELRGEKQLAEAYWQRAYEADPGNRYLAFAVARRLMMRGQDSAALALAQRAKTLPGKRSGDQYELLAKLYVKDGSADSARRYFNLALDSARYQDMTLLYDYSLFLEAVQDKNELIRVYGLLLPQVNFISTLFQRQLNLLLDLGKDSAVVQLFADAYETTRDPKLLMQMVQGLVLQNRAAEAQAIADTLTANTEENENIVNLVLSTMSKNREQALQFLKKKVYQDHMDSPVMLYYLGNFEQSAGEKDSAKVHLLAAYRHLEKSPAYAAQACRALAGIAFAEDKIKEAVRYAEQADSLLAGGDREFLALTYGYAGRYERAYVILDSLLGVWGDWKPMEGVVDASTLQTMKRKADATHRHLQNTYAQILVIEARSIEDNGRSDSLKLSYARDQRIKALLFWESMMMADSSDLNVRYAMAMNLERLERYDESFAIFDMLMLHPGRVLLDVPELLNYYGYSLIDLNRSEAEVEKGFKLVLKALSMDPDSTPSDAFLDSKAWGLYRKGLYAEALETMKLVKSPRVQKDFVYWEHLAAIQAALGMRNEAAKSYRTLLKLRPGHPEALKFLKGKK